LRRRQKVSGPVDIQRAGRRALHILGAGTLKLWAQMKYGWMKQRADWYLTTWDS